MKYILLILLSISLVSAQKIKVKYSPRKLDLFVNNVKLDNKVSIDFPVGTYRAILMDDDGNIRYSDFISIEESERTLRYRFNATEKRIKELIMSIGIQFPLSKWGRLGQLGTVDFGILTHNDFYWGLYLEAPTPGGLIVGLKEKQRNEKLRTAIGGSFGALFNEFSIDGSHTTTKWFGVESRFIIGVKQRFMLRAALMYGDVDIAHHDFSYSETPSNFFPSISMAVTFRKKRGYEGVIQQ